MTRKLSSLAVPNLTISARAFRPAQLQGSYAIIDHQERFVAPHALAFTPSLAQ